MMMAAATWGSAPLHSAQGTLMGERLASGAQRWLGVPFASPPVGEYRWQPPRPGRAWSGGRNATRYGPSCMQSPNSFTYLAPASEDCLYLNIYKPAAAASASPLPILLFFYGGSWVTGSAMTPLYGAKDVVQVAQPKAIVVAANCAPPRPPPTVAAR